MIWITRPVPDSETFARQLAMLGIPSLIAPVMRIRSTHVTLGEKPEAIVLTSRNAAHALPPDWKEVSVYCVGAATADAVRARGYQNITYGQRGVLELADLISHEYQHVLYLSGEEISLDLPALLTARGFVVERVIAYNAEPETELDAKVIASFRAGAVHATAFFSARTAQVACDLLTRAGLTEQATQSDAFCLSLKVAESAGWLPWKRIVTCPVPTHESMLELLSAR